MYRRNMIVLAAFAVAALPFAALPADAQELSRVERQVRRELVTLNNYTVFDNIVFKVDDSKVTLMGHVTRPVLKRGAEKSIRNIEGVQEIDNQIQVLPVSPNDDRIRTGTYRAIYYHPVFTRHAIRAVPSIHIVVENGDVTLEGFVNSEMEKNLAYSQARGVAGAFSVTNNLMVVRD